MEPVAIISDEEYLPLPKQIHPIPTTRWNHPLSPLSLCDPSLQLTPEKMNTSAKVSHKHSGEGAGQCGVACVKTVTSKTIPHNEELQQNQRLHVHKAKCMASAENVKITDNHNSTRGNEDSLLVQAVVQRHFPKEVNLRQTEPKKTGNSKKVPNTERKLKPILSKMKPEADASVINGKGNPKKHVRLDVTPPLSKPKLHSTGVFGVKLQELEKEEFDAKAALAKSFAESEDMRSQFAERVAEGVNLPWGAKKYSGLVSVDVCEEEALHRAVEDKLAKFKIRKRRFRPKESLVPVPDVLDVLTPDMLAEQPNIDVSSLTPAVQKPTPLPMERVFDLYHRIQSWQT